MHRKEIGLGFVLMAISVVMLAFVVPYHIPSRSVSGMSVALFPTTILWLLILCSALLVAKNALALRRGASDGPEQGPRKPLILDLALLASLPLCYLAVRYLGFGSLAIILTTTVMLAAGERRWWRIALVGGLLAAAIWSMMHLVLHTPTPGFF